MDVWVVDARIDVGIWEGRWMEGGMGGWMTDE